MVRGKIVDILKYVLGLDTKDFEKNAVKADQKIDKLGAGLSRLGKIAATAAAGFAAFKLLDFVKDATMVAARTQVLGTVVREVGRGAGYSAEYLDQLTERIKALGITTQSARVTITRFIQSNLDLADAAKLARVAQDLAVISGQNSSQAMETITQAIAAQFPRLLRQFGIVTDLTEIYDAQAKTLGKTAEQLTQLEKKQAFVNVILEEGEKVAGSYVAAMGDVGKQITSLPRHFEELQNAIGGIFLPALSEGVQALTKSLKGLRRMFTDDLTLLSESIVKTEGKITSLKGKLPALVDEFVELRDKTERTREKTAKLYDIQKRIDLLAPGLIEDVDAQGIAYKLSAESVGKFIEKLELLKVTFGALKQLNIQDQLKLLKEQARALGREQILSKQFGPDYDPIRHPSLPEPYPRKISEINKQLTDVNSKINLLEKSLGNIGKAAESGLGRTTEEMKGLGEAAEKALRKIKIPPIVEDIDYALMRVKESIEEWDFHLALKIIDEDTYRANLETLLDELDDWGMQSTEAWLLASAEIERINSETADRIASEWEEANEVMQRAITIAPDRKSYRDALKAYRDMLLGMKRNLEAHGKTMTAKYAEIIEGIAALDQELIDDIQSVWDKAETSVYQYGDAVSTIFDNIDSEIGQLTRDLSSSIANIVAGIGTGGTLGGFQVISGVVSGLGSMFGLLSDSNNNLVSSQYQLVLTIQDWISAAFATSKVVAEEQRRAVDEILGMEAPSAFNEEFVLGAVTRYLEGVGIELPEYIDHWDELIPYLEEWTAQQEFHNKNMEGIFEASTQQQRRDIVTATFTPEHLGGPDQPLSYQEAGRLIDFWTGRFDLSLEDIAELWQEYLDTLITTGQIDQNTQMRILQTLDNIDDQIAARDELEEQKEQTQWSRSIARITEKQADSLIAILSTIDLHLRNYLQTVIDKLNDMALGVPAGLGGGVAAPSTITFTGDFYLSGGSTKEAAADFIQTVTDQLRSVGGVALT